MRRRLRDAPGSLPAGLFKRSLWILNGTPCVKGCTSEHRTLFVYELLWSRHSMRLSALACKYQRRRPEHSMLACRAVPTLCWSAQLMTWCP